MVSMLETIAERHPELPTRFVHGTLNGATHAMRARVKALAERAPGIAADIFYAEPRPEDRAGLDYDRPGLITPDWLRRETPVESADYYLCGPKPFLRSLVGGLARAGVPAGRIHHEFFGPADELLVAA